MRQYRKPWRSYAEQLDQLMTRGMIVTDRALPLDYLERIGYYRLSGYWSACRERRRFCPLDEQSRKPSRVKVESIALDSFQTGTKFEDAINLYVFDKKLRLLTMDALERIEVAIRVDLSHTLGKLDAFAYLEPLLFHGDFSAALQEDRGVSKHHEWLGKHAQLISRSKEDFVCHNRTKYGLPLAIWVACEVWDFGTMSTLSGGMRESEQDAIPTKYGVGNGRVFATWLRSLNYFRNVCAHHSRLWNRNIVDQPKLPSAAEVPWVSPFLSDTHAQARCFLLLKIARHMLRAVNPRSSWPDRMKAHLQSFPDLRNVGLNLAGMGAPTDWDSDWK